MASAEITEKELCLEVRGVCEPWGAEIRFHTPWAARGLCREIRAAGTHVPRASRA